MNKISIKKKLIRSIVLSTALLTSAMTTSVLANETISIVGSSSVTPLMEAFSETYMKSNPTVFIEVQGPGSSAGIKAASNGSADIGMSSRELKESEKTDLEELVIARDGIAIVINANNDLKSLTTDQVAAIYRGEVKNWKEVGGADKPIVVVTRDSASGTRTAFEDILKLHKVIGDKKVSAISQRAQVANGNGALKTMIASNPYAIGYISLGTVDSSVHALAINGVEATSENVKNGTYQISRPFLVLYKNGKVSTNALQFLEWMKNSQAQELVVKQGYIAAH